MTNPFAAPQQPAPAEQPQQQAAPANPFGAGVPAVPAAPQQQMGTATYGAPQQYAAPAAPQQQPNPYSDPYGLAPGAHAGTPSIYGGPQQQAPAAAPSGPVPNLDPNALSGVGAPPPSGGGKGPKIADMYNRLVLVFPHSVTRVPRNPQHITAEQRARGDVEQDRMTATIVVLDMGPGRGAGGTIEFGGAPYAMPPTPHTDSAPLPYVRKAMWITQSKLITMLRDYLPQPGDTSPRMAAGRVARAGNQSNDPWYLSTPTGDELALCQTYIRLVTEGQYPHPLA